MRLLSILVLLLGIGIAGTVAYMVMNRLTDQDAMVRNLKGQIQKNVELVKVPVASKDLTYGKRLGKKDVKYVDWPKKALPKEAFVSAEALFGTEEEENEPRTVIRAIDKGEIISSRKVTAYGADAGVASRLKKGMRAFALRVDVASGVSGFLRPGDRIDVFWTGKSDRETITKLILDGIDVIAVDQTSDEDRLRPTIARTITVAVSPELVASLAQAQATGKLQMSLRGYNDDDDTGEEIIANSETILGAKEVVAPQAQQKVCTVTSRTGNEVTKIVVPCPKENQ